MSNPIRSLNVLITESENKLNDIRKAKIEYIHDKAKRAELNSQEKKIAKQINDYRSELQKLTAAQYQITNPIQPTRSAYQEHSRKLLSSILPEGLIDSVIHGPWFVKLIAIVLIGLVVYFAWIQYQANQAQIESAQANGTTLVIKPSATYIPEPSTVTPTLKLTVMSTSTPIPLNQIGALQVVICSEPNFTGECRLLNNSVASFNNAKYGNLSSQVASVCLAENTQIKVRLYQDENWHDNPNRYEITVEDCKFDLKQRDENTYDWDSLKIVSLEDSQPTEPTNSLIMSTNTAELIITDTPQPISTPTPLPYRMTPVLTGQAVEALPSPVPSRTLTPSEKEVKAVIDAEVTAAVERNLLKLQSLYATDASIIDMRGTRDDESDDIIYKGWQQIRNRYREFFRCCRWESLSLVNLDIKVLGNRATGIHEGILVDYQQYYKHLTVFTLEKRENKWLITSLEFGYR